MGRPTRLQEHQMSNPWVARQHARLCPQRAALPGGGTKQRTIALRSQHSMPSVTYSQNKRDVTALDVALLLNAAKLPYQGVGTHQKTELFRHWLIPHQGVVCERMLQKLTRAVDRSVALVAAFTNCDVYETPSQASASNDSSRRNSSSSSAGSSGSSGSGGSDSSSWSSDMPPSWNWSLNSSNRSQRKRSLIGFARAGGDGSLAATIYDLAVHPDFQGWGVGQKLLKVLTQQLYHKEVYDIGTIVPWEASRFFTRCQFEEDREESETMCFVAHHEWKQQGLVQGVMPGPGWLLDPSWRPNNNVQGTGSAQHTGAQGEGIQGWNQSPLQGGVQGWTQSNLGQGTQAHQIGVGGVVFARRGHGVMAPPGQVARAGGSQGAGNGNGGGGAGVVAGSRQGARWWGLPDDHDRLARVPAPATEALQASPDLMRLLHEKIDQAIK